MAVLIKRYANRKLYNTETSRYITLKGIADLLESDQDVKVIDNESGEDITSVTLSQILVDTERDGRSMPGNLLTGLFQRGGDALRKRVDDASEGIEELKHNLRRLLPPRGRGWVAVGPPDFESIVHNAFERVAEMPDLPRRSDIERRYTARDVAHDRRGPARTPARASEPRERRGRGREARRRAGVRRIGLLRVRLDARRCEPGVRHREHGSRTRALADRRRRDGRVIGMLRRGLAGFDVDDESLALETIRAVGVGETYLGQAHTLRHFRELFTPGLLWIEDRRTWMDGGSTTLAARARVRIGELLRTHEVPPLPQGAIEAFLRI